MLAGNRQFLMVAQYGNEKHLLGVSSSSINHLAKLNENYLNSTHSESNKMEES